MACAQQFVATILTHTRLSQPDSSAGLNYLPSEFVGKEYDCQL